MPPPPAARVATDDIRVCRCRDPWLIEEILTRDFYEEPVCYFPKSLRRAVAHDLFAASEDAYFLTAELDGQHAGTVFGHTFGQKLWRKYARAHVWRHGFALAWVVLQQRSLQPARRFAAGRLGHTARLPSRDPEGKAQRLLVPRLDGPFRWGPDQSDIGHVDLLVIPQPFRGHGLAPRLLRTLAGEMAGRGVTRIEAHIDADNYSSLCAFIKAGWNVYRTSNKDFYARIDMINFTD